MGKLIGTVGYWDETNERGFIHPDSEFREIGGLNVNVTPESLQGCDIEKISSGLRVTCTVTQGQGGAHASDIKEYGGQGLNA